MNNKQKLDFTKLLTAYNRGRNYPTSEQVFTEHCKRYIKAIKQGRMICAIDRVSASGMSRNIKFLECAKGKDRYHYLTFWELFCILGYTNVKNTDTFRIGGCGMDMIFHTNYSIIHQLKRLGFITDKTCEVLAQKTPNVI